MAIPLMRRALAVALGASMLVVAPGMVRAQRNLEYEVKAAYLYNFLAFIEWRLPPVSRPDDAFRICVIGADPFGPTLDNAVRGERVAGRPILVSRFTDEEAAATCQVVFVSRQDDLRLPTIVKAAEGRGVLIVGETPRVLPACGSIAFVQDGERLRFDVNLVALRQQGLRASSKLLRVARDPSARFSHCER